MLPSFRKVLREFPGLGRIEALGSTAESGGFSGAKVFQVQSEAGRFALRIWPDNCDCSRIGALHRLLAAIAASGLKTVAVPRAALDGSTLVCFQQTWCQLEPWMPGRASYHAAPSRQKLMSAIDALGDWHTAASRSHRAFGDRRWFETSPSAPIPVIRERLERFSKLEPETFTKQARLASASFPNATQREMILRLVDGIRRRWATTFSELQSWSDYCGPVQPCLRDIWHDHVLFVENQVTGLIDPAAARTDSIATDLARCLGSLVEDQSAEWEFALNRYAERFLLSPRDRELVFVLDRSAQVLMAAHWLERLMAGNDGLTAVDPVRVNARLARLARRLESSESHPSRQIGIADSGSS